MTDNGFDLLEAINADQPDQPEAAECVCGRIVEPRWWEPPADLARRHRGRWCLPVIPCESCTEAVKAQELKDRIGKALERAGIGAEHAHFRLDRLMMQRPDEPDGEFCLRVAERGGWIGVGAGSVAAVKAVKTWKPGKGSVLLHGPVGRGKSLLAAALVAKLVTPGERSKAMLSIPQQRAAYGIDYGEPVPAVVVPRAWSAVMVSEADMHRRCELGWSRDKDPLAQFADTPVLVVDDFGSGVPMNDDKRREKCIARVERLVDARWRERRPTIFTSNMTPDELIGRGSIYGRRVGSRLADCLPSEFVLHVDGPDWREMRRGYARG